MTILRNIAECALCHDVIESKHRHDFVSCGCGEIFTDGGTTYIRRGAADFNNILDRSVYTSASAATPKSLVFYERDNLINVHLLRRDCYPFEEVVTSLTPSGLEVYYSRAPRRYYQVRASVAAEMANEHLMWREVPSVTSVLGVLDKPALSWWGMKVGVEGVLELVAEEVLTFLPQDDDTGLWATLAVEMPDGRRHHANADNIIPLLTEHKLTVNHVKNSAAKRGVNVHTVFEKWSVDQSYRPVLDTYPEAEQGYIRGLIKFFDDIGAVEDVQAEVMVGSLANGFAGRYDLRFTSSPPFDEKTVVTKVYPKREAKRSVLPTGKFLVDLKTSKRCYPSHALQLAAYELASIECGYGATDYRYVLHVTAEGQYEFVKCNATAEDFLSILQAHNTMSRKDWF